MKVMHITLHRDKLLSLAEQERTFLLSLGHLANELNATTKFLNWAASAPATSEAEDHGRFAIMLMFIRLLAGSLNEAWELYRTSFFGVALSKTYEPRLDDEGSQALRSLKAYFSSRNAVHIVRNNFAFHYSPQEVATALPKAEEYLHAYLDKSSAPNNLFHFSETLLAEALLAVVESQHKKMTLLQLVEEFFDVSLWFAQASDALMAAIIDTHAHELRAKDPEEVQFGPLQDFRQVTLPWFTDTTAAVATTSGSA